MKKLVLTALLAAVLTGCGGGSSGTDTGGIATPQRLVGEIVATAAQVTGGDLLTNAGYAGNLAASYAIQAAGKAVVLDIMFVRDADGEAKLIDYVDQNALLLTPGVRVLVADELFWQIGTPDTPEVLQPQLDAFAAAVALVRKRRSA